MCHNGHGYVSVYRNDNAILSLFLTNHIFCSKSNTTSVLCGTGTVYPSGEPEFTPLFSGVRVARALMFCVMFCISFISPLSALLRLTAADYLFGILKLFINLTKIARIGLGP
jgi:hypothetical protein